MSMATKEPDLYAKLTIRNNGDLEIDGTGLLRRDKAKLAPWSEQSAQTKLGVIMEYHTRNGWEWVPPSDAGEHAGTSGTSSIIRNLATGAMYRVWNYQAQKAIETLLYRGWTVLPSVQRAKREAGLLAGRLGIPTGRTETNEQLHSRQRRAGA